MKQIILTGVLAGLAWQGAGCSSSNPPPETATIHASWVFKNTSGATTGCPAGFDTADIFSQEVDANGTPIGQPFEDLYDCSAGAGASRGLPPARYQEWVEIQTHDGSSVYAQSLSSFLDVTDVDMNLAVTILNDGGYFQLQWDLVGASSQQTLLCADVSGIDGVEAISTNVSNSSISFDDKFTCEDHYGVTDGMPAGTYTVSVDAFMGNAALGSPTNLTNKVINDRNEVTNLGTVNVSIDGQ